MTESQYKEKISAYYFSILTTKAGYLVSKPSDDFGVDLSVKHMDEIKFDWGTRFVDSGLAVDIQLKCTTSKSVAFQAESLRFDLPVKNYNDLVYRAELRKISKGTHIPLVVVLVILPPLPAEWVFLPESLDQITLSGRAFWFKIQPHARPSRNKFFQRITIPLANQLTPETFALFFAELLEQ